MRKNLKSCARLLRQSSTSKIEAFAQAQRKLQERHDNVKATLDRGNISDEESATEQEDVFRANVNTHTNGPRQDGDLKATSESDSKSNSSEASLRQEGYPDKQSELSGIITNSGKESFESIPGTIPGGDHGGNTSREDITAHANGQREGGERSTDESVSHSDSELSDLESNSSEDSFGRDFTSGGMWERDDGSDVSSEDFNACTDEQSEDESRESDVSSVDFIAQRDEQSEDESQAIAQGEDSGQNTDLEYSKGNKSISCTELSQTNRDRHENETVTLSHEQFSQTLDSASDNTDDNESVLDCQDVDCRNDIFAEIETIEKNPLTIFMQGLRQRQKESKDNGEDSNTDTHLFGSKRSTENSAEGESLSFENRILYKGRCYQYDKQDDTPNFDMLVGISRFLSKDTAECVIVIPFEKTFLGIVDEEAEEAEDASYAQANPFVTIEDSAFDVPIKCLGEERLKIIPSLIYKPQMPGEWHHFAYYQAGKKYRYGKRVSFRYLDLFAGCGGMSQGFNKYSFSLATAIDKDPTAIWSFTSNKQNAPVFVGDVKDFLARYSKDSEFRKSIGPIEHVHASPPCNGLSGANRNGGKNDKANNDLSLSFVEFVRQVLPITASYENVLGLWKRKNIQYLKKILSELLKLGYQVRCSCLRACDYGDPQKRPRIIILAARNFALLPSLPEPTHGSKSHQLPFVTARDALRGFEGQTEESETEFSADYVRLEADAPAPAVRGSGSPPIHYSENRTISIEEAKALQSFPPNFKVLGRRTEQRRQIGNAVPVELATAIVRSIRGSLIYRYAEEEMPNSDSE